MSKIKFLLIILLLSTKVHLVARSAVTYNPAGGRLGDQLIGYLHAKWVAYKFKLPFLYKPFAYSDQLMMHELDEHYTAAHKQEFMHKVTLQTGQSLNDFVDLKKDNTLYIIPYFPEIYNESRSCSVHTWYYKEGQHPYFLVDWRDIEFHRLIQRYITPREVLSLVYPPSDDRISIAVQIRKNSGGFDFPLLHGMHEEESRYNPQQIYVDVVFPMKHPPESYYVEQLKRVIEMYPEKKFYVYIFTDDPDPLTITKHIEAAVGCMQAEFACRNTGINTHFVNVLEDMFSMTNFACFIRPDSNLGIVADKIGDHTIVVSPRDHVWEKKNKIFTLTITKVDYSTHSTRFGCSSSNDSY